MLSSLVVEVKPEITIGRLHKQEEKIIEESGIPYTFLRANFFMQNFVTFYGNTIKTQNAFLKSRYKKYSRKSSLKS